MNIVTDIEKLRQPTKEVKQDDPVLEVAAELLKGMSEHKGQGLAANQLGFDLRMFMMEIKQRPPVCLVNPVITKTWGSYEADEACLSLPGVIVRVKRPMEVRVKGVNQYFKPVNYHFRSIEARRACHEIDHLWGKLIIDYRNKELEVTCPVSQQVSTKRREPSPAQRECHHTHFTSIVILGNEITYVAVSIEKKGGDNARE